MADTPQDEAESTAAVQDENPTEGASNEKYDFKRPNRIPKEQEETLTLIHESYAQAITINLSAFLRSEAIVNLQAVEQLSFQEYLKSLSTPTCIATFDMQPLSGFGVIEVNAALVFAIIDKMLGGDGSPQETARSFTDIELSIARKLLNLLLSNLSDSWSHILNIHFGLKEVQTNPAFIRVIGPREPCVTASIKVTVGEVAGMMTLCLPYATLEPISGKLRNDQGGRFQAKQSDEVQNAHRTNFGAMEVDITTLLGKMEISMTDLLRLQEGDILDTGQKAKNPLEVRVAGKPKFLASPGLVGRHRGFVVQNEIGKE